MEVVRGERSPRRAEVLIYRNSTSRGGNMKIRPLQDRILVKRVQEEERTKGGIIIPDSAKEKPVEGEVIAIGSGKVNDKGQLRALDVKKGDRILFGKYSGTEEQTSELQSR